MKFRVWDSLSPRQRKLVFWVVGLLLFYTIAGFLILPPIIRAVAVKQLSQQLDREVSIQKVKINPFAFSTAIRGLLIKDKDGEAFVSWDEVYVNFQLSSFLGHPWVFKEITVAGPFARVEMNKDGTFNFSDLITKFSPTNAPAAPPKAPAIPIALRIGRVQITNATASVTEFALRNFKLAGAGARKNLVELDHFAVTGISADVVARVAEIGSVSADSGRLFLLRTANNATNVTATNDAAPAQTSETATIAPGGIPALLGMVTNYVAQLLHTTNLCTATVHDVEFTNCAFHLEDLTASRPARLDLDDITLSVRNISNVPGTNLTVGLSLRWNTNGAIKTDVAVSLSPLTVDVQLALDRLDFGTLDPYLESKLNLFIPSSQFGLHGQVRVRTPEGQLPGITFCGDTWIDRLRVVDGVIGEDLLKWNSVRVSGIEANVNPLGVAIKEIALDNVAASLVIGTNHTINLLAALHPTGTNALADTNAPATNNAAVAKKSIADTYETLAAMTPPISIGSIVISNASASFIDHSLTPNMNMAVQKFGGDITGLSSTETRNADVNLHAAVDGVGPVDITGRINPFNLTGNKDLKITVKDMGLTPASPYSGKFAGYRIVEGKLNLDLTYDLVGRDLKSKNVITLDRFTFGEKVESPDATHLPVRLAIALLKDRNGQILLDVPVEGSLDDPKFRVGRVVWHTILNILTKAATSPFSLLGALVGGSGEELSYQDFSAGQRSVVARQSKETGFAGEGTLRTARPATGDRRQH
jgi:hypothetical protein